MRDHKNDSSVHNFFKKIATTPDRSSYIWKDGQPSILATIILWVVWVCRFFSLLQWTKAIFRLGSYIKQKIIEKKEEEHEQKVDIYDKGSKRRNIPPCWSEIYYLIWFGVMMLFYFLELKGLAVTIITYYFLFVIDKISKV